MSRNPSSTSVGILTSVVCASIDLDWVSGFIERSGLPPSTVLTVLDGQGIVQYRSVDLEKYVGQARGRVGDGARHGTERRGFAGLDGVERLYVAEPLEFRGQHTGTRVTLGIALAPYRADLNAALLRNIALLLTGTLLCFLIAWLVGEALFLREVRPIVATARKVSAGDLEARTGFGHERGELRELGRAIDDAVAAQQASHRDLVAAREQAVEANRAKGSFLAMMSHEIRTPMNAIINMNGLALETDLPPKAHQYISVAHSSARNLLGILNDILDFSKIEADKLQLEEAPFSVRDVLEEVTETFRATVIQKHVELVTHAVPAVPDRLVGDALRFRQVLTNLVGNAFKFTHEGEVVLRVEPMSDRGRAPGPCESARHRAGYRDRDPERAARQAVSGVHASRQLDVAPIRRHGPRAGDQPAAGAAHGRRPHLRERSRRRHDVLLHRPLRDRRAASGARTRRSSDADGEAGAGRGGFPDQPGAARDASQKLVDSRGLRRERGGGPCAARAAEPRRQRRILLASSSWTGCCLA